MKHCYLFFLVMIFACSAGEERKASDADTVVPQDTFDSRDVSIDDLHIHGTDTVDVYSNQRFKNVYAEKTGTDTYRITGKAQVFEATVSWVVEDGHNELKKGFVTADEGAPAFGNFSFEVTVPKQRPNSTLHVILFESSAKDGSRQHELPVPLP